MGRIGEDRENGQKKTAEKDRNYGVCAFSVRSGFLQKNRII